MCQQRFYSGRPYSNDNFLIWNGGCSSSGISGSDTGVDHSCAGNGDAATFEFDSAPGVFYPVIVYPRKAGITGQFAIQVTDFESPPNDYCTHAVSLEVGGSPLVGSTVNATAETRADDVIHSVVGNGRRLRISTCFQETTTAHNFLIRNGGCSSSGVSGSEVSTDASCSGNAAAAAFEFDSAMDV